MPLVLVLQHSAAAPPGYLADALEDAGAEWTVFDLDAGMRVPSHHDWAGIVSLGGLMAAYADDHHTWLAAEKSLLRSAVAAGVPVLGICLGCQILAEALGGRALPGSGLEVGLVSLQFSEAAAVDPVIRHMTEPVPVCHGDTWEAPVGADLLARSDRYPHAFRMGAALGLQSHPEAPPEVFANWVRLCGEERLVAAGVRPEVVIADVEANAGAQKAMAMRLFGGWLGEVAGA